MRQMENGDETMRSQVMKRAWALARAGAVRWGGSVRSYFSSSLRMAWALLRDPCEHGAPPADPLPELMVGLWFALLICCLGGGAPVAVVVTVAASGLIPLAYLTFLLVRCLRTAS
jgi:hypothetical protein